MDKWENTLFGKNGRFYPCIYLMPVPILGIALFLLGLSITGGFEIWERLIIIGFGLFFLFYFFKAIEAIIVSRSTIREVTNTEGAFHLMTFSGRELSVRQMTNLVEDEALTRKKNVRFLFPADAANLVFQFDSKNFYISGGMSNFDSLREALYLASQSEKPP